MFSPFTTQTANIETLGLLGKMATTAAIFEPFRNPATKEEITDCLLKLLEVRNAIQREANRNKTPIPATEIPQLWVLTPTASEAIISGFGATLKSDWVEGVYFLPEYLRTAIVVIHQLPSTQETLWLRILGRGRVQQQAVDELTALPANHPFVEVTLELLYSLQQNLRINQNIEIDDRELVMRLAPLYQEDRARAIQEGEQKVILRLLNRRFGEIDLSLTEQIKGLSTEKLEALAEQLLYFNEVADLAAWLKQQS